MLWERRRRAWERRFVLRNGQPWVIKTDRGLGCIVCKATTGGGNWAKGTVGAAQARASVLLRHQASQQHKAREAAYLGQELGPSGVCMAGAPCPLKLKEVLHGLQRGKSEREEGRGSKVAELRWAIAEAYASLDRAFLGKATSVALCRDERHGKLLVRFSATTEDFEHRNGTIALVQLDGCTAFDLVAATRKALTIFCACFLGSTDPSHPSKLDKELLDWIRTHVEVVANDAASNEMLAGDVGRGRRVWNDQLLLDGCNSARMPGSALENRGPNADNDANLLTPNLMLVHRDHAHCARRVLVRPWKADEELERLMTDHILGGDSVVQLVHRSPVLSRWFQQFIDGETASLPKVHCLRAAKHKFETSATPLGRFCIHLVSLLRLARKVVVLRKESGAAPKFASWLRSLDGDDLVQLAMLADACDEALGVVRALDTETADIAALPRVMGTFLERVQFLFQSQWCCNPASEGFTTHVLRLIESGCLQVVLPDERRARVLTASPTAIERACARMQVWVALARQTIHAEFPNFALFNAFSIFDLREGASIGDDNAGILPLVGKSVRRLAQAFDVDPDELSAQLERHKPIATNIQQSRNCGNHEAWREALAQTQRTLHGKQTYPTWLGLAEPAVWNNVSANLIITMIMQARSLPMRATKQETSLLCLTKGRARKTGSANVHGNFLQVALVGSINIRASTPAPHGRNRCRNPSLQRLLGCGGGARSWEMPFVLLLPHACGRHGRKRHGVMDTLGKQHFSRRNSNGDASRLWTTASCCQRRWMKNYWLPLTSNTKRTNKRIARGLLRQQGGLQPSRPRAARFLGA